MTEKKERKCLEGRVEDLKCQASIANIIAKVEEKTTTINLNTNPSTNIDNTQISKSTSRNSIPFYTSTTQRTHQRRAAIKLRSPTVKLAVEID